MSFASFRAPSWSASWNVRAIGEPFTSRKLLDAVELWRGREWPLGRCPIERRAAKDWGEEFSEASSFHRRRYSAWNHGAPATRYYSGEGSPPDTLLAYELNGQPLPVMHGFPLRYVPGWAGDSWIKWLQHIEVLDHKYDGFWMKSAYRYPKSSVNPGAAVNPADTVPVTSLGVKSVIAKPLPGR